MHESFWLSTFTTLPASSTAPSLTLQSPPSPSSSPSMSTSSFPTHGAASSPSLAPGGSPSPSTSSSTSQAAAPVVHFFARPSSYVTTPAVPSESKTSNSAVLLKGFSSFDGVYDSSFSKGSPPSAQRSRFNKVSDSNTSMSSGSTSSGISEDAMALRKERIAQKARRLHRHTMGASFMGGLSRSGSESNGGCGTGKKDYQEERRETSPFQFKARYADRPSRLSFWNQVESVKEEVVANVAEKAKDSVSSGGTAVREKTLSDTTFRSTADGGGKVVDVEAFSPAGEEPAEKNSPKLVSKPRHDIANIASLLGRSTPILVDTVEDEPSELKSSATSLSSTREFPSTVEVIDVFDVDVPMMLSGKSAEDVKSEASSKIVPVDGMEIDAGSASAVEATSRKRKSDDATTVNSSDETDMKDEEEASEQGTKAVKRGKVLSDEAILELRDALRVHAEETKETFALLQRERQSLRDDIARMQRTGGDSAWRLLFAVGATAAASAAVASVTTMMSMAFL